MKLSGSEIIIQFLKDEGVEHIFGYPGGAVLHIYDALFKQEDVKLLYDVCHNIAKVEEHFVGGVMKKLLVHRKGSTRAFPPHHPNIPKDYQSIGQPDLRHSQQRVTQSENRIHFLSQAHCRL